MYAYLKVSIHWYVYIYH